MKNYCACGQEHCGYPDCRHGDLGLYRDEEPDPGPELPDFGEGLLVTLALFSGCCALLIWGMVRWLV